MVGYKVLAELEAAGIRGYVHLAARAKALTWSLWRSKMQDDASKSEGFEVAAPIV